MEEATPYEIMDGLMEFDAELARRRILPQPLPRAPRKTAVNDGFGLIRNWLVA